MSLGVAFRRVGRITRHSPHAEIAPTPIWAGNATRGADLASNVSLLVAFHEFDRLPVCSPVTDSAITWMLACPRNASDGAISAVDAALARAT